MPGPVAAYRPAHQEPFGGISEVWHAAMLRAAAPRGATSGGSAWRLVWRVRGGARWRVRGGARWRVRQGPGWRPGEGLG